MKGLDRLHVDLTGGAQTDRRFHGSMEDIENISFHPRQPNQITDREAIDTARKIGYELEQQNGKADRHALNEFKETIARVEKRDPKFDAIVSVLRHGNN